MMGGKCLGVKKAIARMAARHQRTTNEAPSAVMMMSCPLRPQAIRWPQPLKPRN